MKLWMIILVIAVVIIGIIIYYNKSNDYKKNEVKEPTPSVDGNTTVVTGDIPPRTGGDTIPQTQVETGATPQQRNSYQEINGINTPNNLLA